MNRIFTMNKWTLSLAFVSSMVLTSCDGGNGNNNKSLAEGASGDMTAYVNSDVNAIQQALPTLMVLPSDNLLQRAGCLKTERVNGRDCIVRNYGNFFTNNTDFKNILSSIQSEFVSKNYPLQDLEQMLKQLDTQSATDMADGLEKDAKTALLTTAQPDMIIELDYVSKAKDLLNPDEKRRNVSYTVNVIDAYSSKVISTVSGAGEKEGDLAEVMKKELSGKMSKITSDIQNSFSDILTRGREITVRLTVSKGTNVHFSDASVEGDTYADWVVDYMKTHTVKGAYKMQRNTESELYFVNCRIGLLNEDGTQYGVYDWARDFCKNLRKNLGLKVTNKAQGLGEVLISIEGLN